MIDGTQGIETGGGLGRQAVAGTRFGGVEELFEEMRGQGGHVAGDDQVPVGSGDAESRVKSAKRAAAGDEIGDYGISEGAVAVGRADDGDVSGHGVDGSGNVLKQRRGTQGKQSFVAAHAGTAAAGKDESRVSPWHEMMIPYVRSTQDHIAVRNNFVYICSLLAIVMLAASPTMAADVSLDSKTESKTLVVRADPRTGRLVRVSSHPGSARPASTKKRTKDISEMVERSAKAHNVDPLLVDSMIQVESDYNVHAVSNKGAEGLMQLTPGTARMLGVSNSFDPEQNIEAGVKYLKYLQSVYKDDRLALAAYNAGPGAVEKYKQIPPYRETQNYVNQVGKRYEDARKAAAEKAAAVPAPAAETAALIVVEEKHPKLEQFVDENGRLHLRTTQ
jgi:soluble lytic murein transglycosylase-like protein